MKLGNFFRALTNETINVSAALVSIKGTRKAHVDGYEFEKAILGHYGDYHLVAGFAIVIEERETPCVCLDEKGGGLIERLIW